LESAFVTLPTMDIRLCAREINETISSIKEIKVVIILPSLMF
jgi:hypothetical protein